LDSSLCRIIVGFGRKLAASDKAEAEEQSRKLHHKVKEWKLGSEPSSLALKLDSGIATPLVFLGKFPSYIGVLLQNDTSPAAPLRRSLFGATSPGATKRRGRRWGVRFQRSGIVRTLAHFTPPPPNRPPLGIPEYTSPFLAVAAIFPEGPSHRRQGGLCILRGGAV
jgi:hypothetical protein